MSRELSRWIGLSAALALAACSYNPPEITPPDGGDVPTINFKNATTLTDEKQGPLTIDVEMVGAGDGITVDYKVVGGNAIRGTDYVFTDGTVGFSGGNQARTIDMSITMDALEETDETVVIELSNVQPAGAANIGQGTHTITISADILSRVTLTGTDSQDEGTDGTFTLTLDLPAKEPISVDLAISGTAQAADHTLPATQTVTFAVNETVKTLPIGVVNDDIDEDDQTVDGDLAAPVGLVIATGGGHATHTIQDNDAAPTVEFAAAAKTQAENVADATQQVVLVGNNTERTISVDVGPNAGATTSEAGDVTFTAATLTFPPGTRSVDVPISIVNDTTNEPNDVFAIRLTNVSLFTSITQADFALTITDNDPVTVAFKLGASNVTEGTATTVLDVDLSTDSESTITVEFVRGAGSVAVSPGDFTFPAQTTLTFAPSVTTQTITVTITQDAIGEVDKLLNVTLQNPAVATLGAPATHALTIRDDDCRGTGNFKVCPSVAPTGTLNLNGTFNTGDATGAGANAACAATQAAGWTAAGNPAACFVFATNINVTNSSTLVLTGVRPLVLFASNQIDIDGEINASAVGTTNGAGARTNCPNFAGSPQNDSGGAGGGAGGSFMTKGGDGGTGDDGGAGDGNAANADGADPTTLRGGCRGQDGADGDSNTGGLGGGGGGAVYLIADGNILISGEIDVSGGAGQGGQSSRGGGGGAGSGGMILIEAGGNLTAGGVFMANGAGGGQGADDNTNGGNGTEPSLGTPNSPALGGDVGTGAGAVGGNGFAGGTAATFGADGIAGDAGGGGGGGGGFVQSNKNISGTISAGKAVNPP